MQTVFFILPLAQAADPVAERSVTLHPPAPYWLPAWAWYLALVVFLILAISAAVYLYRAQQRIASKRVIVTLTAIRTALIALMFVTLVGAGCQFTHTGNSNGTLWLMLDQSASMAQTDPQSTPLERLRWADALGYLPAETRCSPLGRQAARLTVLREDLGQLQSLGAAPVEDADARRKVEDLAKGLQKWNEQVASAANAVEQDPQGKAESKSIGSLRDVVANVAKGIERVGGRAKPEEAANDVPWRDSITALDAATAALRSAADNADKDLLARGDAKVKEALDRAGKLSRAQLAQAVLTAKADPAKRQQAGGIGAGGFEELLPKQTVKVLGFGDQPQVILPDRSTDAGDKRAIETALVKPAAPATDIATALRTIGDQVGQSDPASVVIVSDGRQNKRSADLADAARRLSARGVRVYALAFGSQAVAPDAAVETVDAPDWVFKGDNIRIAALLRLDGLAGRSVDVELHRLQTQGGFPSDTLVDTKSVTASSSGPQDHKVVTFTEKKDELPDPGLYDYRVVIKPVADEAVAENNSQTVRVSVKDHKLAALMIEDQPRWEYRYVANYLSRDNRVKLQTILLQSARIEKVTPPAPVKASPENERTEAQILPETQDEWYKFDLIFIGDLPPERLPRQQQEMIAKAVTERGATLILSAGPLNLPANWGFNRTENPLTQLFPVEPNPDWTPQLMQQHVRQGWHPAVAPDGNGHILTQFGLDEATNDRDWTFIRTDPDLAWYWHSEFTQAKGGAQVIWSIAETAGPGRAEDKPDGSRGPQDPAAFESANKRALLATMNVGLGKVMYLAADATWRLRQVNGQNLHERFWGQVIRWVVGNDLPAGGQFVKFGTDKPRYVNGESAVVTARVFDKHLAPLKNQQLKVIARQLGKGGAPAGAGSRVDADMTETPESPGQYRATLGNLPSGRVEISIEGGEVQQLLSDDPTVLQRTLTVEVEKGLNLEQKNINADRPTLASVTRAGGGAMLDGCYADVLADQMPELNYKVTSAQQIGLFADAKDPWTRYTHWVFLGAFVVLVTAEWIIRKAGGLV